MTGLATREQISKTLPREVRNGISEDGLNLILNTLNDPTLMEEHRENILGYVGVLRDGRFKIQDYLNAVKYVSYKLLESSNLAAWIRVFPDRYNQLLQNGISEKDISSHVAAYNKNKLVNLIYEQTLIPSHVLNAHIYQKAINTQAELMLHANSEKVRSDAANSLLTHLKPPEVTKIKLDVEVKESSAMQELREITRQLAIQQQQLIMNGGATAKVVAESQILEGEIEDAEFTESPEDS
jgi:NADH dehydrogenase/NADH:ubiquinone oxidoreductase subunit G